MVFVYFHLHQIAIRGSSPFYPFISSTELTCSSARVVASLTDELLRFTFHLAMGCSFLVFIDSPSVSNPLYPPRLAPSFGDAPLDVLRDHTQPLYFILP